MNARDLDDTDKLIAAMETIDLLRENLSDLVTRDGSGLFRVWWSTEPRYMCAYCQMESAFDSLHSDEQFPHAPDCPIARGRQLLKDGEK